jgi:hypothetical protein
MKTKRTEPFQFCVLLQSDTVVETDAVQRHSFEMSGKSLFTQRVRPPPALLSVVPLTHLHMQRKVMLSKHIALALGA